MILFRTTNVVPLALTVCALALDAPLGHAEETPLWRQFVEAKETGTEPILPDFSYAGYHRGERAIPHIEGPVFDVTRYGAVADDEKDDQEAIQRALDAAAADGGGVVRFPSGRFRINTDRTNMRSLRLTAGGIVLRGSGAGKGGTVLEMVEARDPTDPEKMYSTPYQWIVDGGGRDSDLAKVTSDARRESFSVEVEDPSKLSAGMWVQLVVDSVEAVPTYLAPHRADPSWTRLATAGIRFQEIHQVASIDEKTITFEEPIRADVHAAHGWKIRTWSHIQEVGVEDLCFAGGWRGPFRHHRSALDDSGYSALQIRRVANSWVRRCSFVGWNQCLLFQECASSSALELRLAGARGHCAVLVRGGGDGVLVGLVHDQSGHHHGPSVGYRSSAVVFWRYTMHPDQPIDSHSGTPIATLLDRVDGGRLRGSGGPRAGLPNHLGQYVLWNFDHRASSQNYDFWARGGRDNFVHPLLVGLHGNPVQIEADSVGINESPGRSVDPESLYEAQIQLRLGEIPAWIAEARKSWETTSRMVLPGVDEQE